MTFEIKLKCTSSLRWAKLLEFLAPRGVPSVESVNPLSFRLRRTLRLHLDCGWVACHVEPHAARILLETGGFSGATHGVEDQIRARARCALDLDSPVKQIENLLGPRYALNVPGAWDPFEMGVRAILGQQVTVKAAHTLAGRLAQRYGHQIQTPWEDVNSVFPCPATLAGVPVAELQSVGLTRKRAETLSAFAAWSRDESGTRPPIRSLPGIGPWTESYIAMRSGADPDAFPAGDLGIHKALGLANPGSAQAAKEAERLSQAWKPFRAYAVMQLWNSLAESPASPNPAYSSPASSSRAKERQT